MDTNECFGYCANILSVRKIRIDRASDIAVYNVHLLYTMCVSYNSSVNDQSNDYMYRSSVPTLYTSPKPRTHARTVDTRHTFPLFNVPGYEANIPTAHSLWRLYTVSEIRYHDSPVGIQSTTLLQHMLQSAFLVYMLHPIYCSLPS